MITSPPDYHKEFNLTRPLANEFLAMSTTALIEDVDAASDLCAVMKGSDADINYLEWYLARAVEELERRRKRYELHRDDPFPPVWPDATHFQQMRAQADAVKDQLSIEQYLASQVPFIELKPYGNRIRSLCPCSDHNEETPSFVIFEDGRAWCFGCSRGGDIFRIIGLVEGLPRFRDQLDRALQLVPEARQEKIERPRLNKDGVFHPIKIANGRVIS